LFCQNVWHSRPRLCRPLIQPFSQNANAPTAIRTVATWGRLWHNRGSMEHILALNFNIVDFIHDPRPFLAQAIDQYHNWIYAILFLIIFCETGLVVMPFLPGDSLLFAAGTFAAALADGSPGPLKLQLMLPILIAAPILGDSCNYWIGRFLGPKIFHKEKVRFLNKEHLNRAHKFYERHGGKAVAIGRFRPIIRTFMPLVAGIGKMNYVRFLAFSVIGSICWISICIMSGFLLAKNSFVQKHFEVIVIAIVVISLLPAVISAIRMRAAKAPARN
jgi:membrane-associated protein